MTSNYEIKSQLAKLLATEDLVVEHKKVETAQFNVQSRVLTLPVWENTTDDVIDMLVSHEVGHALYTPDREWWKDYQMNPSIVNIVEDARIEKLMKRRYEGIAKTFYKGYTELHKKDFFQVKQKDISEMNLLDRINLQFKIGTHYNIPFSTDEMFYVNKVSLCETFDEVLKVSKQIFDYILGELEKKKEEEEKEKESQQSMPFSGNSEDGEPTPWDDWGDEDDDEDADEEEGEAPVQVKTQMGGTGSQSLDLSEEVVSETAESLEEALKNLANTQGRENVYLELPKLDIDELIIDNELIHNLCKTAVSEIPENDSEMPELYSMANFIEECKVDFVKFKRSAQKEVNYLVKEFECKKSADAYARASTARTGILNTGVLHTYKFNEDLFKKVTVLPDGKNHGLVFILDWSGSMSRIMLDTLKQLYNLMWFCKKVQIPFEVYAFTICYPKSGGVEPLCEAKVNQFDVDGKFSLLNMFTSKTKGKVLEKQMKTMFRIASTFTYGRCYDEVRYNVPLGLNLSGTPLHETLIALHQILPSFQKDNDVQKVQCVILTDGEGHPLTYHSEHVSHFDPTKTYLGSNNSARKNCFLRCRKTGKTYSFGEGWYGSASYTDAFLKNLRDKFPNMNFIGIRLLTSGDSYSFLSAHLDGTDLINARVVWRNTKTASIKTSGYHTYFGLSSNALSNDTEFEVKEDATKADIKKAFAKTLKGKKMNKKILSEFIELVA